MTRIRRIAAPIVIALVAVSGGAWFTARGAHAQQAAGPQSAVAAVQPPDAGSGQPASPEELTRRVKQLEERAGRLEAALRRVDTTLAAMEKFDKALTEGLARLAAAVDVASPGTVRINGNLRLDSNVIDDEMVVNCDKESSSGSQRRCKCPDGRVATGIELRPLAVSATPGPATYNTSLVCGRP